MSLLETIKNLFSKIAAETSAPATTNKPYKANNNAAVTTQLQIPEDSALKRHFISTLKCQVESEMPARPTESTLKRHYDSTVQAKLESLLA